MTEKYEVMFGKPPTAHHVSVAANSESQAKELAIQKLQLRFDRAGKSDTIPTECFIRKQQEY